MPTEYCTLALPRETVRELLVPCTLTELDCEGAEGTPRAWGVA